MKFGWLCFAPFCCDVVVVAESLSLFLISTVMGYLDYLKYLFLGLLPSFCSPEVGDPPLLAPPYGTGCVFPGPPLVLEERSLNWLCARRVMGFFNLKLSFEELLFLPLKF